MKSESTIKVYIVDAFTHITGQGNPAGVVPDAHQLTEDEMQLIAKKVNFNETVFIFPSEIADFKFRYFTPGHETPLCGHATFGGIKLLSQYYPEKKSFLIETGAGVLPIQMDNQGKITMRQAEPQFISYGGEKEALANILSLSSEAIHDSLPIYYGNTGSWTLLVPLKSEEDLGKIKPKTSEFPTVLKEIPRSSIHPFVVTSIPDKICSARHFSSPYSETTEDSVTGTASGVMVAYLQQHLYTEINLLKVTIVQGKYVGREGTIEAEAICQGNQQEITITGEAVVNPNVKMITY